MTTTQFNARIPELTVEQIDSIAAKTGLTKTQIVILAIDRLYQAFYPDTPLKLATLPPPSRY